FFVYSYGDHPHLHSFPTRRSSDLSFAIGIIARPANERAHGFLGIRARRPIGGFAAFADRTLCRTMIGCDGLVHLISSSKFVAERDRKSTRLNSSHEWISYAVFCLK